MPCTCEGFPPSPCAGDLIGSAEAAMKQIKDLEKALVQARKDNKTKDKRIKELEGDLATLKRTFSIMGNGG